MCARLKGEKGGAEIRLCEERGQILKKEGILVFKSGLISILMKSFSFLKPTHLFNIFLNITNKIGLLFLLTGMN